MESPLWRFIACSSMFLLMAGCGRGIKGSGFVKTESRDVSGLNSVVLDGEGRVTITQSGKESLTITAENNILPLLEARVSDHVLRLGTINNVKIDPTVPVEFKIEAKRLEGLQLLGAGSMEASSIQGQHWTVAILGAGQISVEGVADSLSLDIQGAGKFNGKNFRTRKAAVNGSGAVSAVVNVSDQLDVKLSGVGLVEYIGSPTVNQSVSGVGSVKRR